MIDKERLAQKCSTWNIALSPVQLDLLDRYAALLVDYNQKVNLTAITSPRRHRGPPLCRQPALCRPAGGRRQGGGRGYRRGLPRCSGQDLQTRPGIDPDGTHRQAGGFPEVPLRRAGPDRGGICQGARRGGRPQSLAGTVRRGLCPGGGCSAGALRILPAAGQAGRQVHRPEGPRSRRRGQSRRQCPEKAGRSLHRDPHLYPCRTAAPRGLVVCEKISQTSDRLSPERRKKLQKSRCNRAKHPVLGRTIFVPIFPCVCYAFYKA